MVKLSHLYMTTGKTIVSGITCSAGRGFTTEPPGKPLVTVYKFLIIICVKVLRSY